MFGQTALAPLCCCHCVLPLGTTHCGIRTAISLAVDAPSMPNTEQRVARPRLAAFARRSKAASQLG